MTIQIWLYQLYGGLQGRWTNYTHLQLFGLQWLFNCIIVFATDRHRQDRHIVDKHDRFQHFLFSGPSLPETIPKILQELRMLSSVRINCQVTNDCHEFRISIVSIVIIVSNVKSSGQQKTGSWMKPLAKWELFSAYKGGQVFFEDCF